MYNVSDIYQQGELITPALHVTRNPHAISLGFLGSEPVSVSSLWGITPPLMGDGGGIFWAQCRAHSPPSTSAAIMLPMLSRSRCRMKTPSRHRLRFVNESRASAASSCFSSGSDDISRRTYVVIWRQKRDRHVHLTKLSAVTAATVTSQNHSRMKIFSLNKLIGSTHWTM